MSDQPLEEFTALMRRLRRECPWKREQTHASLVRFLVEETYETVEAIEAGDTAHLREELGDLLLQIYFHAAIAEERGEFTIDDVARDLADKMRRRNPHVFGGLPDAERPGDAAAVEAVWQAAKAGEKRRERPLEGLPAALPALLYADKALTRLEQTGRPVPGGAPAGEGLDEVALGERLLDLVAAGRRAGLDPEQALRGAVHRLVEAPGRVGLDPD